ncbi:MAG: hypothetical protein KF909_07840 [Rhodocyclaceae bacterium]|nr:hypothetical protein [Rhodocyclaceae bacterium]MCP5239943.1 hypothetical protein [Zoogloeaceae bacterium]MCB1910769.1 hypothetical protein [Rhodocyclaceae bacterium]MCP5253828.1 hypothetical protein [Zoogloeaceae bacterium]MCP5293782.1 hypothetical protein [Zoogloeaceae bacterium]
MRLKTSLIAISALAVVCALSVLSGSPSMREARAQPSLAPQECTCSAGVNLAPAGAPASVVRNCQCGALQCVVHVQSGQLQCR